MLFLLHPFIVPAWTLMGHREDHIAARMLGSGSLCGLLHSTTRHSPSYSSSTYTYINIQIKMLPIFRKALRPFSRRSAWNRVATLLLEKVWNHHVSKTADPVPWTSSVPSLLFAIAWSWTLFILKVILRHHLANMQYVEPNEATWWNRLLMSWK